MSLLLASALSTEPALADIPGEDKTGAWYMYFFDWQAPGQQWGVEGDAQYRSWNLGDDLSSLHAILIVLVSLLFTAGFTYAVFYRDHFKGYEDEFVKRLVSSYLVTLTVSALVLLLVDKFPLIEEPGAAIRRAILVAFPATFSATVVDSLK